MLENVPLFASVSSAHLEELESRGTRRTYPKNTILVMEGDDSHQLFVIESGTVSIYVAAEDGKQVVLDYLGPGDYFGELALMDGKKRSASAVTLTQCTCWSLAKHDFRQFLNENAEAGIVLIEALVGKIRALTSNVKDLATLDVYGRVTQLLQKLDEEKIKKKPRFTHQDIANQVGASREMVSKIMKELVVGGYIEQQPSGMVIRKKLPSSW